MLKQLNGYFADFFQYGIPAIFLQSLSRIFYNEKKTPHVAQILTHYPYLNSADDVRVSLTVADERLVIRIVEQAAPALLPPGPSQLTLTRPPQPARHCAFFNQRLQTEAVQHEREISNTEYTELQPLLSGVHLVMRVKLVLAGEVGGCFRFF